MLFRSTEQLKEVWGFDDTLYREIQSRINLSDTIPFRFIHLNSASYEELKSHPYIGYALTRTLLNYREQHGPFQRPEDLLKIPLVKEENLRKLARYLRFD